MVSIYDFIFTILDKSDAYDDAPIRLMLILLLVNKWSSRILSNFAVLSNIMKNVNENLKKIQIKLQ